MSLERQVKRRLLSQMHTAWVQPGPGCAEAAAAEVKELIERLDTPDRDEPNERMLPEGIRLTRFRYRRLLELTIRVATAQDLLLVLAEGPVHNRRDLEGLLQSIDWQFYLRPGDEVVVHADSRASALYHEGIIHDCVAYRLDRLGAIPVKGEVVGKRQQVRVRVVHDRCRVLISLAGAPLWRRGYRGSSYAPAPLREDLAQAAIRTARPNLPTPPTGSPDMEMSAPRAATETLFVPFSGSGTLLFEYLIARLRIPPFIFRPGYAFERFPAGSPPSVAWVKGKLLDSLSARLADSVPTIAHLVDRDALAVASARENLNRFVSLVGAARRPAIDMPLDVTCSAEDAFSHPWRSWLPERPGPVFLPMNPPYGLRLATRSSEELYRRVGRATDGLAASLPPGELSGFVLCPTEGSWRAFLGAARRLEASTSHFSQGGLDIRLCRFRSRV